MAPTEDNLSNMEHIHEIRLKSAPRYADELNNHDVVAETPHPSKED